MPVLISDMDRLERKGQGTRPDQPKSAGTLVWPSTACLAGGLTAVCAAWISAGSVGLVGLPLRHVSTWLLLALAIVLCRPVDRSGIVRWARIVLAVAAVVVMTASPLMPANALASSVVLAVLATGRDEPDRRVLLAAAVGCSMFGLYRLAVTSVSWLWLAMDAAGRGLGCLGTLLVGRELPVAAAFAGVDFLVLAAAIWLACLMLAEGRRRRLAAAGLAGLVLAEAAWLAVLAQALRLAEIVDPAALQKTWSWQGLLAAAVPWNLPILAVPIFLLVILWMLRMIRPAAPGEPSSPAAPLAGWHGPAAGRLAAGPCSSRRPHGPEPANNNDADSGPCHPSSAGHMALSRQTATTPTQDHATHPRENCQALSASRVGPALLALSAVLLAGLLPVLTTLSWGLRPLEGRKIVASANVFGNWERPVHGQYGRFSIGMYGMLYQYIQSLGGQFVVSEDLRDEDLRDASALLLIYPHKPWQDGQVERILNFAGGGGTVLVYGEHTILEEDGGQRFNDILQHTHMRIRFDTAEWAVGGWMQSLDVMGHPIFTGIPDDRYGVVIGASVDARWPARPLMTARWGFRDRGDAGNGLSKLGNQRFDPDEPLGDVVLAAEEPFGAGRIIAFGDPGSIINGITIGSHVFTSRLFSYIAGQAAANPQNACRQWLAMAVLAILAVILLAAPSPWAVGLAAATAAASLAICTAYTYRANEILPDGRAFAPINRLAYIDDSHLEAFSGEAIREDLREGGLQGLTLTLMRSGYLALMLPEFSPQRIERAGMILSIAPSREFSEQQRRMVRKFVEEGGTYILMAGYEEAGPSRQLLADFGFEIGRTLFGSGQVIDGQPRYMRYFRPPYVMLPDGQFAHVRFQIAWPVLYKGPPQNYRVFAYGPTLQGDLPIIAARYVGKGKFVVIGDTFFAMNRNLERMDGQPIEGLRENAEFWRWFLGELNGVDAYMPTNKAQIAPPHDNAYGSGWHGPEPALLPFAGSGPWCPVPDMALPPNDRRQDHTTRWQTPSRTQTVLSQVQMSEPPAALPEPAPANGGAHS